jgi:hypothetical protein
MFPVIKNALQVTDSKKGKKNTSISSPDSRKEDQTLAFLPSVSDKTTAAAATALIQGPPRPESGPLTKKNFCVSGSIQEGIEVQFHYAEVSYKGGAETKNIRMAKEVYKKIATLPTSCIPLVYKGIHVKSQCNYAEICYREEGITKDLPSAREFWKKVADLDPREVPVDCQEEYLAALLNYASMCYEGEVFPVNLAESKIYYQKAANLGLGAAVEALETLFEK